jgi:hypothetical protein
VAAIDGLKERNLGITRKVNILGTVGNKLHETTSRHFIITVVEKKISAKRIFKRTLR